MAGETTDISGNPIVMTDPMAGMNPSTPGMPAVQGVADAQKQAMLGKLLMQGASPQGGMAAAGAGGNTAFYVPQSPMAGLSSALQKGIGAYMYNQGQQ